MPLLSCLPVRVALVFPHCSRRGGVERIMWEAAAYLAPRHEMMVVAREVEDLPEGLTHVPVAATRSLGPLDPVAFRFAAARALGHCRADVTVAYGSECPPCDVYVVNSVHRAWLARSGPAAVHGRRLPPQSRYLMPRHVVGLAQERVFYGKARHGHLVPASAQVASDLASLYGLTDNPVTVIHNGFSPDEFSPERRHELRAKARAELGYGPDDVVLLMVANEWQRKGLAVVLSAMARLDDRSVRLLLVGLLTPQPFVDALGDPSVRDRVQYLGSSPDVGRQHAAADLFVMPTEYEAFSLAIVEALASGVPVLTSSVPGAGDAIVDGVNGLRMRDPHDVEELVGLLGQGMDPEVRTAWSRAAPGTVTQYRWDALMGSLETVLEEVVWTKRATGG